MKDHTTHSKSERTRLFIIEKVAPIFNRKGYAGTSLSDLTKATGLTKGAIYGNFKNKDEVATEAFKYNLSKLADILITDLAKASSPVEKLRAMPAFHRKIYDDITVMGGCPILNTATDADDTHPQLRQLVQEAVERTRQNIKSFVSQGIEQGQIKCDADGDKLAGLMVALVEGSILVSRLANDRKYLDNALDQVEHMIDEICL